MAANRQFLINVVRFLSVGANPKMEVIDTDVDDGGSIYLVRWAGTDRQLKRFVTEAKDHLIDVTIDGDHVLLEAL